MAPFAVFFSLAAVGVARLVGDAASDGRVPRVTAGLFYAANPFVFDRVAVGQIVLLGYALLPLSVASMLRTGEANGLERLAPAGWWAALTAFSVHFLWIGGVVMLAVVVVRRARPRGLLWGAASVATVAVLSAYLFCPQLGAERPVTVGATNVAAYATRGDPHLGLYSFWR